MPDKPKVAFYWCASCGGCEESIVDLAEDLLGVVSAVEVVLWPVAMDFKKADIEAMEDGSIAVSFINGAVRMGDQEEWVHLLRRKSGLVVAHGSCAHLGGIPGLANLTTRDDILQTVYRNLPGVDNPEGVIPQESYEAEEGTLTLPRVFDSVKALDQVIDVDYYLPGCAPPPALILSAVQAILKGELPDPGSVLSPNIALCDECPRKDSKPEKMELTEIKRVDRSTPDPDTCFLAEGYICMGPATRSGCEYRCIEGNMPCRGCFGALDGIADHGAKFLSSFAAILGAESEEEIQRLLDSIPDPAGTFYRFSLPKSLLHKKRTGAGK